MPAKHPNTLMPIQSQTGHIKDIKVYRKGRRCPLCKKILNSYTQGPYCLAHEFAGAVLDAEKEDARFYKIEARNRRTKDRARRAKKALRRDSLRRDGGRG